MPPFNEIVLDSIESFDFARPVIEFISDKFSNFGDIVWFIFFVVLVFFTIYSLVLVYHWFRYSIGSLMVWIAMIAYFTVSFVLLNAFYLSALNI
ncbi:MAG: hypothetical protein QGG63_00355 [Candidatus Pacebacteria bacterium]|jgi:hypothetical protein|nr:hypothetical protein [Candidatus Paceibacterota bacterium]|tara:strand:- start:22229 stop:22510 length:282 start_codon:yes stop_codon:yes gene_type:complete